MESRGGGGKQGWAGIRVRVWVRVGLVLGSASALFGKAITPAGHIRQNIYIPGLLLTRPNLFSVIWPTIHPHALIAPIYIDFY